MPARVVGLLRWLPAGAALIYATVLGRQLVTIVAQLTWNPDYDSQMVIAESVGAGGKAGRAIVVQLGYFWFDLATRALPDHRQVWEYAPYVMALVSLGLLAWAAWRLVGGPAAFLTAALGLAASPLVLATQVAQAYHGSTWFGTSVLAAFLCWLLTSGARRQAIWTCAVAVALVVGLATGSDPLLAATGVAPFAAAALLIWRARPQVDRHRVIAALAAAGGAAAVAGTFALASRLGGYTSSFPRGLTRFVLPSHFAGNVHQLISGVFEVAGMPKTGSPVGVILGALLIASLLLPPVWLIRSVRPTGGTMPAPLLAVIAFWTASELFLAAAFLFSDVPADFLETSSRYLVPLFYVAIASVPLWAGASDRRLAAIALPAAAVILANAAAVDRDASNGAFAPYPTYLSVPLAFLEQKGLTRGYASYWEAAPMTWKSSLAVHIYPVTEEFITADERCGPPGPGTICPFAYNSLSDWYTGAGGPTFILVDPIVQYLGNPPTPDLEPPIVQYSVGRFTIFVYADDVAAHMGLPRKFTRPLL